MRVNLVQLLLSKIEESSQIDLDNTEDPLLFLILVSIPILVGILALESLDLQLTKMIHVFLVLLHLPHRQNMLQQVP